MGPNANEKQLGFQRTLPLLSPHLHPCRKGTGCACRSSQERQRPKLQKGYASCWPRFGSSRSGLRAQLMPSLAISHSNEVTSQDRGL